ncbi:hypothetical protein AB0D08_15610 [Kitasatospora sp. NPDC048540]|uniref:hypothetical protein n=1 Tax=unclassified Kitasatospora TaxID=2633591 RepID=UPI00053AE4D4|nr:hypothetical protein [Kitasatospora sp. MBT63]
MAVPRSLTALVGAATLSIALAGCADPPVGTITASDGTTVVKLSGPFNSNCQGFAGQGVTSVINRTLVDIVLHHGPDCTDPKDAATFYLATDTSIEDSSDRWLSFSVVN